MSSINKKYKINENFFKTITRESAYVLGWVASDGCIQYIPNKKYSLRFELKDYDILTTIKDLMKTNIPIRKREEKNTYLLVINNKKIIKSLLDLNMTPNKTYKLQMPHIDKKYYPDFIRGYFDGDGSVYLNKHNKNAPQLVSYICSVNKNFLKAIGNYLREEIDIIPKIHEESPGFYKLKYGAKESYAFYKLIYNDTDLYLKRKKDIFDNAIEIKAGIGLMNCKRCGKEIIRTSGRKRYCSECKKIVLQENERKRNEKRKKKRANK